MGLRQQVAALAADLASLRESVAGHVKAADVEAVKTAASHAEQVAQSASREAVAARRGLNDLAVIVQAVLSSKPADPPAPLSAAADVRAPVTPRKTASTGKDTS